MCVFFVANGFPVSAESDRCVEHCYLDERDHDSIVCVFVQR